MTTIQSTAEYPKEMRQQEQRQQTLSLLTYIGKYAARASRRY
jgi:hypothetical protein